MASKLVELSNEKLLEREKIIKTMTGNLSAHLPYYFL
jgi:hypothetical protein